MFRSKLFLYLLLSLSICVLSCSDDSPTGPDNSRLIKVPQQYSTIQTAINAATNGDTVLVGPGTYNEAIDFGGKLITVKSSDGPVSTIITNSSNVNLVTFSNDETPEAVLEGFLLDGGYIGILCENAAPTIRRNILINQTIPNWGAISLGGDGYATRGKSPAHIINNTILFCNNGGISTFSSEPPIISNNIIAFNDHYGIHREGWTDSIAQPILSYNCVYGNLENYQEIADSGTGTISQNPKFVDSFYLYSNSPCIDAGDPNVLLNDPDDSRCDIGALPYDSSRVPMMSGNIDVPYDYSTIQEAIDSANTLDTIIVWPGVYFESLDFKGKAITVKSKEGPLNTTITNYSSVNLVTFTNNENEFSVLDGFKLQGGRIGILCENAGPTIKNNILSSQNITIWGAISLGGDGYATLGASPAQIINNTIVNCANGGISTFSTVAPLIKNNIIAFNNHYAIHRNEDSPSNPHPIMSYNCTYGNLVDFQNISEVGDGHIYLDPKINPDYSLKFDSPCINNGDPDSAYNDPDGSRNDIGAVPYSN